MESSPSVRIRLLGGFEIYDLDGVQIRIIGRRARGLMAMLCLEGRGGLLRDRICGLLWADRPDEQARGSLRQCLFELRSALGARADDILEVGRERVSIRPGSLLTDIDTLKVALHSDDQDKMAGTASQLASGPLLEGMDLSGPFQEWLDQARGAWEAALLDELTRRLASLEAASRWEAVRLLSEGYLRRDPLQEAVAAAAIRADLASGRPSAAQRRYLAIRQALSDELGVAPGAELERAIQAENRAGPPAERAAPKDSKPLSTPSIEPVLAVLAFENQSGDPDFLYFSDGISEEILHAVSQ
ncbi:MAG: BTAD domain-containing putative transcriptional regulator, partial [Phenylobacterium sp.]|uniref:BTAD domain-containing putative transcriptional regulator n=1 Tax=Phenylobacterium sp. TaxID=1871053 RepID=UPI003017EBEE